MTTASITIARPARSTGALRAFWNEMLAAWIRHNELEVRLRSGR